MTHDQLVIVAIAGGCAASVGVVGLIAAWVFRGASLRWLPLGVALVAVTGGRGGHGGYGARDVHL